MIMHYAVPEFPESTETVIGAPFQGPFLKAPGVLERVAKAFGVSVAEIKGDTRRRECSYARFAAYRVLSKEQGWSSVQIGRVIGNRDHTTVLYGLQRAEELTKDNALFRSRLAKALLHGRGE